MYSFPSSDFFADNGWTQLDPTNGILMVDKLDLHAILL